MDEDFDYNDPNNQIDDDFVMQAMKMSDVEGRKKKSDFLLNDINEEENNVDDDNLSVCGIVDDLDYCSDGNSNVSDGKDKDDKFNETCDQFTSIDEIRKKLLEKQNIMNQEPCVQQQSYRNRSLFDDYEMDLDRITNRTSASTHFTEYSMSSSVMPRTENLKMLDKMFEQMYIREYSGDLVVGPLDGDEDLEQADGIDPNTSELMDKLVKEYHQAKHANFGQEYERNQAAIEYIRQSQNLQKLQKENDFTKSKNSTQIGHKNNDNLSSSSDTEYEEIEIVDIGRKGDKERLDCESILSTYSNTSYHPKVWILLS